MDIRDYNRTAWNGQVASGNPWTIPVTSDVIAAARRGEWQIVLTPTIPVPRAWFGPLVGRQVLCLASGGGQQGPILAAAGAHVTVLDNSPAQLAQDQAVAEREGLELRLVEGDMRDLSAFADNSFDLIIHPVSNQYVPDVRPVWQEALRVLKPGAALLSGFLNPIQYIFDFDVLEEQQRLEVRYSIPYSDTESLEPEKRQVLLDENLPMEFGHSLDDQIGGQLAAGFVLAGFYEDRNPRNLLARYIAHFIATRAVKPVAEAGQ